MSQSPKSPDPGERAVDAAEAIRRVRAAEAWLLDVREVYEWQTGHAEAAHHIPMGEVASRREELPVDKPILVICHSGQRSRQVMDALLRAEYSAANVEGGMDAWQAAGGDVIR